MIFFFSIENLEDRWEYEGFLIVENDFTDGCDSIFGAREMSNVS